MDPLSDWVARATRLHQQLWDKAQPPAETAHDAVRHDKFDEWDWNHILQDVPPITRDIKEINVKHDYVADHYEDLFNALYQGDPKVRDKSEMDPRRAPNVDLIENFMESREFQSLQLSTRHDPYNTAMALLSMKSAIIEAYERAAEAFKDAADAEDARQELQDLLDQLADLLGKAGGMEDGDPGAEGVAGQIEDLLKQIEEQTGITVELDAKATQSSEDAGTAARGIMRGAAMRAEKEIEEDAALMYAYGQEPPDLQRMSFEERRRLSETLRNSRLFDQLPKLAGQLKNIEAGAVRKRVTDVPEEVTDITSGDELSRMAGSELLNFGDPTLELEMMGRLTEGELVVDEMHGHETLGRGPIICLMDGSGSMGQVLGTVNGVHVTAEAYGKATAFALMERAKREHRDFIYIEFSSHGYTHRIDFPAGKSDFAKAVDMVEHFFGGGTYYEGPLREAMAIVEEYGEKRLPRPDIIFITDDCYGHVDQQFLDEWNELKERTSMRCFGVLMAHEETGAMDQIADDIRSITDMTCDPNGTTRGLFKAL